MRLTLSNLRLRRCNRTIGRVDSYKTENSTFMAKTEFDFVFTYSINKVTQKIHVYTFQ